MGTLDLIKSTHSFMRRALHACDFKPHFLGTCMAHGMPCSMLVVHASLLGSNQATLTVTEKTCSQGRQPTQIFSLRSIKWR